MKLIIQGTTGKKWNHPDRYPVKIIKKKGRRSFPDENKKTGLHPMQDDMTVSGVTKNGRLCGARVSARESR